MKIRSIFQVASLVGTSMLMALTSTAATAPTGKVVYSPDAKVVQGNQPLSQFYVLTVKAPGNIPSGTATTVTMEGSIISKPAATSDADTLSFLSFSPASLTFTQPNQTIDVTVAVNVPLGFSAGSYAYRIKATGWPGVPPINEGATVNALVSPPLGADSGPPSVVLQSPVDGTVYTYYPVSGLPVSVPVIFDGSVSTGGSVISSMKAYLDGNELVVSSTGLGTLAAHSTSMLSLTTPGLYNVRVVATNENGFSEDEGDFTVQVSAPPPTITVATPLPNATFSYQAGASGVSIPVSYVATSLYGNITATGATLNGQPITLSLNGVGTALTATGNASLQISAPGSYVLQFTASNEYGAATPVVVPFTVTTSEPLPHVSILTPSNGAIFTRTVGDAPTAVGFTLSGGTDFGAVQSVTVSIDGQPVTATVNGLGSLNITGSGSVVYSAAGTHTLSVTLSNGFATATDQVSFTIKENPAQSNLNLTWLAPIVYHKTIDGGTVMPVKFTLDNNGTFVRDETVLISIYEVFADGSIGQPMVFPYGGTNPDMPDYAINGTVYQIDFKTAPGVHKYRVEVYKPLDNTGTNLQLLGTENILTKKAGKSCKSDKSSKSDKSDKSCKSNKSDKGSKDKGDCKSNKSDKSSKSGKSGYGGKDNCGKSGKSGSGHYGKSDKSGKSGYGNYGKSDKSGKSSSGSKGKSDKPGKSSSGSKGKSDKSSKSGSYGGGSNQNGNCPPSSSQSSQSSRGYGSSWGRR